MPALSDSRRLTARLLLVRHGPSSHIHDGRWMRHHAVHEFEDAFDADHEYVRRADAAADWLEREARTSAMIVAVTHGGFRRILAARLVARGWHAQAPQGPQRHANWSYWELSNHG